MPRAAGTHFLYGTAQPQRVDGLHQPCFGTAAAGEMHIGDAIEQHHHRHVRESTTALVESQVHRGGHRAHRADLQVEYGNIGGAAADGIRHIATVATNRE